MCFVGLWCAYVAIHVHERWVIFVAWVSGSQQHTGRSRSEPPLCSKARRHVHGTTLRVGLRRLQIASRCARGGKLVRWKFLDVWGTGGGSVSGSWAMYLALTTDWRPR